MAVSAFQKLEKIGEGTYGIVYKAREKGSGRLVALKKIRPESENEGIPATTIREILLLKNLRHSTIINLMEVIHSEDKMYLVFEYIETDLKKLIDLYSRNNKKFDSEILKKMAFQLCTAVGFCHSKNIFHRDLKPQNILVDENFNIKLGDFGLGRAASIPLRHYTSQIITLWYRPPELLLGYEYYDSSVDVWSLACIIVEMHTMLPLFMGDSEIDQLYKIYGVLGIPTNSHWDGVESLPNYNKSMSKIKPIGLSSIINQRVLEQLIEKMLVYNPLRRITASEALEEPYFNGLEPILE
ncbi:CMGC/CDK/CDK2 protein kinase [Vittaforma corneae ATCC 50505]|uniref:Cyclin-dependent kinase 1 n=1 Tax=Vittaforma corneae (strain ATCC 50505) TaxID=993615 RepID=L2GMC3_VITCO|nr:CMGC/CDK/CDK2 protein kinase [Vittaforma corneae ATCC 50505]ELA41447.1 CMGC/CDK/CDK2 protein kinase [Vittaforma corneae ATCC 50505]